MSSDRSGGQTIHSALGVWDGHDAGAALVVNGEVVSAVSEERLSRIKRQGGWPYRSIREVLRLAGVRAHEVDKVGVAGRWGRFPARLLDSRYARISPLEIDPLSPSSRAFGAFQDRLAQIPGLRRIEANLGAVPLRRRLDREGMGRARLELLDHHRCHAAGAAALLSEDRAATSAEARTETSGIVLTSDGYGDGISTAIWRIDRDGEVIRASSWGVSASPALLYGALTHVLGHREGEEGKLTGLAGLHRAREVQGPDLRSLLRFDRGDLRIERRGALRLLRRAQREGVPAAALALALQSPLEDAVLKLAHHHLSRHSTRKLALSGGLFANVALNGRLTSLSLDTLAVFPAMGDQGLCIGAALIAAGVPPGRATMPSMTLGPSVGDREADPAQVAARLAKGEVLAVARGALEMGPRALGHRSLLFDAGRPELAARVGLALGREPYMPFAPLMQVERWREAFVQPLEPLRRAAGEMTLALPVRPAFARAIPAGMHEDGTARPQAIAKKDDPWLHDVLGRFQAIAGTPALVNTSLNLHREPIVCDLDQALRTARSAELDAAVLGDELVEID